MGETRIYTAQALSAGQSIGLDERALRHVQHALRMRPGQSLRLFNGDGHDYDAVIAHSARGLCRVEVRAQLPEELPPRLRIHLGIAVSRGERMDLVIQKAVELGVEELTPLITERTLVRLDGERRAKRMAHWQGILVSACEQSGRSRLPRLHAPSLLRDWLTTQGTGLLLYHQAARNLSSLSDPGSSLNLLIGPEGGLSQSERDSAIGAGLTAVRLGPRILRTETAPLAALAAIQTLWGDLG